MRLRVGSALSVEEIELSESDDEIGTGCLFDSIREDRDLLLLECLASLRCLASSCTPKAGGLQDGPAFPNKDLKVDTCSLMGIVSGSTECWALGRISVPR